MANIIFNRNCNNCKKGFQILVKEVKTIITPSLSSPSCGSGNGFDMNVKFRVDTDFDTNCDFGDNGNDNGNDNDIKKNVFLNVSDDYLEKMSILHTKGHN